MFRNGYLKTGIKALDGEVFEKAFRSFLSRDEKYRKQYLQNSFPKSIDGYSFMGQADSLNQYDFDQLHSFVLSRFNPIDSFPVEFHEILERYWSSIVKIVSGLEKKLIDELGFSQLTEFYSQHTGHMMSVNYYPAVNSPEAQRLSEHKDVSLFTVFPFGVDGDLKFQVNNKWVSVGESKEIIVFPGYLLERLTKGQVKAVNHKVDLPDSALFERFSFAVFSIPIPGHSFQLGDEEVSSEAYMKEYLSLF